MNRNGGDDNLLQGQAGPSNDTSPEPSSPSNNFKATNYGIIKDLQGSVYNPFTFQTSSEESSASQSDDDGDDDNSKESRTETARLRHRGTKRSRITQERLLKSAAGSKKDKGEKVRQNGNIQSCEARRNAYRPKQVPPSNTPIRTKRRRNVDPKNPANGKSTGRKDPPIYSQKKQKVATGACGKPNDHDGVSDGDDNVTIGSASTRSNVEQFVARKPLHTATQDYAGGVLSQKRTRELDKYLKCYYPKILSDNLRKELAIKVPTSIKELTDANVLDEVTHKKYGTGVIRAIKGFLQTYDIKIKYVKGKRIEEYNPFGDNGNGNSDSDCDEEPKAQIQAKIQNQTREQKNSHIPTKTTHLDKLAQKKKAAAKTCKSFNNKITAAATTQARKSNGTKRTVSLPSGTLPLMRLGIHDSFNAGLLLLLPHTPDILSAPQSEALDQWILKKAKQRAALERETTNTNIEHWHIISNDARKMAALLVPTSEEDLLNQRVFSYAETRLYGAFVVGIIKEFLNTQNISLAEIESRRQIQRKKRKGSRDSQMGRKQEFRAFSEIGESVGSDLDSQLLEQGYCAEWLDKDGRTLCVYGTVTEYDSTHADSDDDDKENEGEYLSIKYAEHSRSLVNNCHTQINNLSILEVHPVNIARAWGGCLLYQEKQDRFHTHDPDCPQMNIPLPICASIPGFEVNQSPVPLRWRVPDLYTRTTIFQKSAPNMPSLCLHYSGFQLEFTVQPSSIPNSGHGVFLSITSLLHSLPNPQDDDEEEEKQERNCPVFSLPPGEVLDIGVYAPLTSKDETPDYIMLVRSFLQSFWCDSYSMNTRDNEAVFDITHGRGELIPEAKKSILPFVNERSDWETHRAEVQLIDDPHGGFHYVLGYRYDEPGEEGCGELLPFRMTADGRPREVFVDYGAQYEMVRLRHGYPRIPVANEEERKQMLDQDEMEKLEIMFDFSPRKLQEAINYVHDFVMFTMEKLQKLLQELHDDNRNNVRERVLAAIIVLHARSEQLRPEVVSLAHTAPNGKHGHKSTTTTRRRKNCYNEKPLANDVDMIDGMSKKDWDTLGAQLDAILEKLIPGSPLSSLLSSLPQQINEDSLLGMACAIVETEKKIDDDLMEGEYL